MLKTNSKKAIERIKAYVIENTTEEANYRDSAINQSIEKLNEARNNPDSRTDAFSLASWIIWTTYHEEKNDERCNNDLEMFTDWMQGLPSTLNAEYYYNVSAVETLAKILEETPEEANKYSEEEAENLLTHLIFREIRKQVYKKKGA